MSLNGKVAIVTGSGRGLGLAYAQELARQGASVVVNDVDQLTADAAVQSIVAAGGAAVAVVAPVGPTSTADALVDAAVRNFGHLDILITNAGVLRDTVLWKMSDDDFDTVINVHLRGTFTCVRAAAVQLREQPLGRPHHLHRIPHRSAWQFRPDQLRRSESRNRRHGSHLVDGTRTRQRDRQRRHPRRCDRHDGNSPLLRGSCRR